ncbi:MAG: N-acetylneuraminate synthase family protein [Armatimonadota bacterium]
MKALTIGARPIGGDAPTYIIAEAGVNHQCDMDMARRMIDEAAAAGADAIKFQTYRTETLTTRWAPRYWEDPPTNETQFTYFKNSDDFGRSEYEKLFEYSREKEIEWLTTPFDLEAVEWMADLGMAAYKIASADLTDWPLIDAAAQQDVPLIVSTGGSTLDELHEVVDHCREAGNDQIILLHCILAYPAPVEEMNLLRIPRLTEEFPEVIIGLSSHVIPDRCVTVPTAAVALGAKVIEVHFTLDTSMEGVDHTLSVDPEMLRRLVENVRIVEAALGSDEITVLRCEESARKYARRSIIAAVDIPEGTVIERDHVIMKRPGTGVSPTELEKMLGRKTVRAIQEDQLVTWDDIEGEAAAK